MKFAALMMAGVVSLFAADSDRKADDVKRIQAAAATLVDIQNAKDGGIDHHFIEKAHCIGIIPAAKKAGFMVAAQYGKGLVTCRIHNSNRWSAPSMIVYEGGSFGLQIGAGETDMIFAVMNDHAEQRIKGAKVELGVDAMAAAGPIGRSVSADTNATMHDEILTWSRSRGVFAGIDVKGGSLRNDNDDNEALYGHPVSASAILDGKVPPPQAHALYAELAHYAHPATRSGE